MLHLPPKNRRNCLKVFLKHDFWFQWFWRLDATLPYTLSRYIQPIFRFASYRSALWNHFKKTVWLRVGIVGPILARGHRPGPKRGFHRHDRAVKRAVKDIISNVPEGIIGRGHKSNVHELRSEARTILQKTTFSGQKNLTFFKSTNPCNFFSFWSWMYSSVVVFLLLDQGQIFLPKISRPSAAIWCTVFSCFFSSKTINTVLLSIS